MCSWRQGAGLGYEVLNDTQGVKEAEARKVGRELQEPDDKAMMSND